MSQLQSAQQESQSPQAAQAPEGPAPQTAPARGNAAAAEHLPTSSDGAPTPTLDAVAHHSTSSKPGVTGEAKLNGEQIGVSVVIPKVYEGDRVRIFNLTVAGSAKPTTAKKLEDPKAETKGETKYKAAENVAKDSSPAIEAKVRRRFENATFLETGGEIGLDGGKVDVNMGIDGKNWDLECPITIFGASLKDLQDPEKDLRDAVKILVAKPTVKWTELVEVEDAPNVVVTAEVSVEVGPNKVGILEELVELAIKRVGLKGAALPFALVEGGAHTLWAAWKGIAAAKDTPAAAARIEGAAAGTADAFIAAVKTGEAQGVGGQLGVDWFDESYQVEKAEHEGLSKARYRELMVEHAAQWESSKRGQVDRAVRKALYVGLEKAVAKGEADGHIQMRVLSRMLFGGDGDGAPEELPHVALPEIVDHADKSGMSEAEQQEALAKNREKYTAYWKDVQGRIGATGRKLQGIAKTNAEAREHHNRGNSLYGQAVPYSKKDTVAELWMACDLGREALEAYAAGMDVVGIPVHVPPMP